MRAQDLMSPAPVTVVVTDSVGCAAELMRERGVGCLPVVDALSTLHLRGLITDRDLVVRCMAKGHGPACKVGDHMTVAPLHTANPADDIHDVLRRMERAQVRRMPVVGLEGRVLGIIAQADIARKLGPTEPKAIEALLEGVSTPGLARLEG
jgi:CBS domain-containing protein